jgi:hypothetical protein
MVLLHRHFGQRGTLVSRLIDPAATMHTRAASMRMTCSISFHACMVARRRARTDTAVQILRYLGTAVSRFIKDTTVFHRTDLLEYSVE